MTIKGDNFGPLDLKGFWGAVKVRDGDTFKNRMAIWNTTPPTTGCDTVFDGQPQVGSSILIYGTKSVTKK